MKAFFIVALLFIAANDFRIMEYNGSEVRTTFDVDSKFYGTYKGRKSGYLELKQDGTGIYHYDVFGFAPASCKKQPIQIEWGFLIDENDKVVQFTREYGMSYPILFKSTGETKFQGCQKEVLLDFIMEYKSGQLGVSSSDDWTKN
ncbi:hypothetical protein [Fulvivirga lutea]|uniref:Uncharacterized protein n=1 Tax=Fulvivirga lutea TaxID=2810512 RepID=A0A974WG34_9BACT|nr:hypothetical protein [Fulvivirga lutea]QSE96953.1 hypothetical protein JR347_15330 [Fulvivirga lutea]